MGVLSHDKVSWLIVPLRFANASHNSFSHVVKWLKQGDKKYKTFFVRRMQQLANGERSRILRKRLKGSATTIFETYLEQKVRITRQQSCSQDIVSCFVKVRLPHSVHGGGRHKGDMVRVAA